MYTYRLMPSAVQDLQEIGDYIATQLNAPGSAAALLNDMQEAIEKACAFPMSLPAIQDELLQAKGYRKIIVKNYIVFVFPDPEAEILNVMRVMYHARNYLEEL